MFKLPKSQNGRRSRCRNIYLLDCFGTTVSFMFMDFLTMSVPPEAFQPSAAVRSDSSFAPCVAWPRAAARWHSTSHARSSNRKKRLTNKCTRQAHSGREHHDIIMTYRPEPWDCPTHTFDFLRVSPSYPNHAQNHTSKSVVFSLFPRCSAINRLWVPKLWSINGIVQLVQIQRHRAAEITWQAPELDPT